jgi:ParB family transcriptional regulator, chromosome partitioning protein
MVDRSNLLRSLGNLAGDMQALDQVATEGRVLEVDPNEVEIRAQVRTTFQEIEELARSIGKEGQQQPCVVGPRNTDTGKYPLYIGERRCRAVQLLPGRKLKVIIDATKRSAADLIRHQVVENEHRSNLLPHEVAMTIKRYREERLAEGVKLTLAQVAQEWEKPVHYINMYAQFLDLPECILSLIIDNTTRDAELLFSLKSFYKVQPEECEAFIREARSKPELMTREQARTKAREAKGKLKPNETVETESAKNQAINGFQQTPTGNVVELNSKSSHGEESHQNSACAVEGQGAKATDPIDEVGGVQTAQESDAPRNEEVPTSQPGKADRRGRGAVRQIDANRIVIAVSIASDEPTKGLLLVNKIVENNPGKCVVEVNIAGRPTERIVDTDCIDIISMAELAPID